MDGAEWKGSGATWIALRQLRSIQATLAGCPVFPFSEKFKFDSIFVGD